MYINNIIYNIDLYTGINLDAGVSPKTHTHTHTHTHTFQAYCSGCRHAQRAAACSSPVSHKLNL